MHSIVKHFGYWSVFGTAMCVAQVADAGLFRAYLSAGGNDANPCIVTAPCRLLPAALAAVDAGGEIWMLDSANYNQSQVDITKSVSILAVPGAVGSIVATGGGDALLIDASGVSVTLRNLVIVRLGTGFNGVTLSSFSSGSQLQIEDCEIANMQSAGVFAPLLTASSVTIKNTVLRDNVFGFFANGPVTAALDGMRAVNNSQIGVVAETGSRVSVSNSVLASNATGVRAHSSGDPTSVMVTHSIVTGSAIGFEVNALSGSIVSVVSDANVIDFVSDTVFKFAGSGGNEAIFTRGNNTLGYFNHDITPGHALTPLAVY